MEEGFTWIRALQSCYESERVGEARFCRRAAPSHGTCVRLRSSMEVLHAVRMYSVLVPATRDHFSLLSQAVLQ